MLGVLFLLSPARRSQIPCVTSGGEISNLIATQPEVLSFKLWTLLLLGIDSKYEYHRYDKAVSKPCNAIEGQITSYFRQDYIV